MSDFLDNMNASLGVQWTMGAVAILITGGRLLIRWRYYRAFKSDDIFNSLALLLLLGCMATLNVENWGPTIDNATAGNEIRLGVNLLLWATLYAVKASFLALLWNVFSISATFRRFWWAATLYTFLTFWPIWISEFWQCGSPSNYAGPQACVETEGSPVLEPYVIIPLWIRAFFHISSDVVILLLPIAQIRELHMSTVKKIGVATTFALILINIGMGLVRNASILYMYLHEQSSEDLLVVLVVFTWLEPALAVIVCALPVYRILLPAPRRRHRSDEEILAHNAADMDGPHMAHKEYPRRPDDSLLQVTDVTRSCEEKPQAVHMI